MSNIANIVHFKVSVTMLVLVRLITFDRDFARFGGLQRLELG